MDTESYIVHDDNSRDINNELGTETYTKHEDTSRDIETALDTKTYTIHTDKRRDMETELDTETYKLFEADTAKKDNHEGSMKPPEVTDPVKDKNENLNKKVVESETVDTHEDNGEDTTKPSATELAKVNKVKHGITKKPSAIEQAKATKVKHGATRTASVVEHTSKHKDKHRVTKKASEVEQAKGDTVKHTKTRSEVELAKENKVKHGDTKKPSEIELTSKHTNSPRYSKTELDPKKYTLHKDKSIDIETEFHTVTYTKDSPRNMETELDTETCQIPKDIIRDIKKKLQTENIINTKLEETVRKFKDKKHGDSKKQIEDEHSKKPFEVALLINTNYDKHVTVRKRREVEQTNKQKVKHGVTKKPSQTGTVQQHEDSDKTKTGEYTDIELVDKLKDMTDCGMQKSVVKLNTDDKLQNKHRSTQPPSDVKEAHADEKTLEDINDDMADEVPHNDNSNSEIFTINKHENRRKRHKHHTNTQETKAEHSETINTQQDHATYTKLKAENDNSTMSQDSKQANSEQQSEVAITANEVKSAHQRQNTDTDLIEQSKNQIRLSRAKMTGLTLRLQEKLTEADNYKTIMEDKMARCSDDFDVLKQKYALMKFWRAKYKDDIAAEKSTVAKLTNRIKELQQENATLVASLMKRKTHKSELESQVETLTENKRSLKKVVKELECRLWQQSVQHSELDLSGIEADGERSVDVNSVGVHDGHQVHKLADDSIKPKAAAKNLSVETKAEAMDSEKYRRTKLVGDIARIIEEYTTALRSEHHSELNHHTKGSSTNKKARVTSDHCPEVKCHTNDQVKDTLQHSPEPNAKERYTSPVGSPRLLRDRTNPLDTMDDKQLVHNYRLDRNTIFLLSGELEYALTKPVHRTRALPASLQILLALRYFATGDAPSEIAVEHGVTVVAATRSIHAVSDELTQRLEKYVQFPATMADLVTTQKGFYNISGFPNVTGSIDTTLVPCHPPDTICDAEINSFLSQREYNTIHVQGICDARNMFVSLVARWPASSTNTAPGVWSKTISEYLEHYNARGEAWILADDTYPMKSYLLTPVSPMPGHKTPLHSYHESHRLTRGVIDATFQMWRDRFQCLRSCGVKMRLTPETCIKVIHATGILHNICLSKGLPFPGDSSDSDSDADSLVRETGNH